MRRTAKPMPLPAAGRAAAKPTAKAAAAPPLPRVLAPSLWGAALPPTEGPGVDTPGELFIGSIKADTLVLGKSHAIVIDNTVDPPVVTVNGVVLYAADAWGYTNNGGTYVLHPQPPATYPPAPAAADFLVANTTSATSTEGPGTRLMFDVSKGAFRAGTVNSTQWNDDSRGAKSVAFGANNTASGANSATLGGDSNTANNLNAAVLGGKFSTASGVNSGILCGDGNAASGLRAAVCGGAGNTASGTSSGVLCGEVNTASNNNAAVLGGNNNTASGQDSVVLGGVGNIASGATSHVGGFGAKDAGFNNSFVWSDSGGLDLANVGGGAPAAQPNGVWFGCGNGVAGTDPAFTVYTSSDRSGIAVGARLLASGSSWVAICDESAKENLEPLNYADTLRRVEEMPIYQFNYKKTPPDLKCRGPTAQDWHRLFPSGKPTYGIDTLDFDGITLAALKGLAGLVRAQGAQLEALRAEFKATQAELEATQAELETMRP